MSKTVAQIFAINPTTVVADTDLYYLVQSPYTPGTDAAITGASLKAAFGSGGTINPGLANQLGYYATSGSTISGLTSAANGILITSGTGVPSISSTLPSAVQANITALGTIASIGSPLGGAFGGTGINNGARTITIGGNFAMAGAFAFTGTLTNTTSVTFPVSGTLATTSQLLTSPLTTKGDIWVWSTTNDRLPVATGDGKILQVSSGAATGLAYSTPAYPSASGTARKILVSDGTNNVYSTETYATPGTSGNVMTSDGTNWTSAPPAITTVLTTKGDILGFSTVDARIPVGTVNGQVLQANSANATGVGYSTPSYPSASGSAGQIIRSDGTNNLYTTSTYPNTNAINTLLYASAANVMSALATANNGLLVTGPTTGTPSILAGPGTTGNMLISNAAAAPSFTTYTIPATAGTAGAIRISDGTNIVNSTSLWPNTVGTSGLFLISNGTSNVYSTSTIPTSAGATANKILLSNGTNYVLSTPTFPNASATTRKIIVSDGTNWVASTETYAVPGTSGNVMTSDGTNWTSAAPTGSGTVNSGTQNQLAWYAANGTAVSGLATANSGVLVTSSGGVPSISSTLPAFTTSSITFSPTTGGIVGTTTNDDTAAGKVGEFVTSVIANASAVSITPTGTVVNVTSISLTAGDWDVWGNVNVNFGGTATTATGWISSTSATLPDLSLRSTMAFPAGITTAPVWGFSVPQRRFSLSGTTTIYLSALGAFTTSTCTASGGIYARRVR